MCQHKKKLFIAHNSDVMAFLLGSLLAESCWFEITPLPDDDWEIAVKEDVKDSVFELPGVEPFVYH